MTEKEIKIQLALGTLVVYVVEQDWGDYSPKVFSTKEKAEKFAKNADNAQCSMGCI